MCKWVWFNKQASPVVLELPVERVGERLGLKAASLQEESTLELAAIEELVNSARLAHLKEKRNIFWQEQAGPPKREEKYMLAKTGWPTSPSRLVKGNWDTGIEKLYGRLDGGFSCCFTASSI